VAGSAAVQPELLEESPPQEEQEESIAKIALYPSQVRPFSRLLSDARDRTGVAGILCTVNQTLDLNDGRLLVELQAARLDGATTRKNPAADFREPRGTQIAMRRYEPRPNFARLWRNRKKQESWQSDFSGRIVLQDGVSYFVGVTVRKTFGGEEYLSLYLRPKLPLMISPEAKREN
jgi:hypothetical protein